MWTPADVAAELAVPEARVHAWIAAELLRASRGRLADGALHRFLCEHRAAWVGGRVTPWIASLLTDPDLRAHHLGCRRRPHAAACLQAAAKQRKGPPGPKGRAPRLRAHGRIYCGPVRWARLLEDVA